MENKIITTENLSSFLKNFQNDLSKANALLMLDRNILTFENGFLVEPKAVFLSRFIEIRKEKILLQCNLELRIKSWMELIDILEKNKKIQKLENYFVEYMALYDSFIDDVYFNQIVSLLPFNLSAKIVSLIKQLGELIKNEEIKKYEFNYLILRATFLRVYCRYYLKGFSNQTEKHEKIKEAERCLYRAEKQSNNFSLFIAKGLLGFYKATSDKDLKNPEYEAFLDDIENNLRKAIDLASDPTAYLTLIQFYRNTYQFQKCCDLFLIYSTVENNKRRLLRYSYLIGESLFYLRQSNWPEKYIDTVIKYALEIHTESLDAGYNMPRIYLSKAYLLAILGNKALAENFIFSIFTDSGSFSWDKVISYAMIITNEPDINSIQQKEAVAKGINNGYFWNTLGTFARTFMQDLDIAFEFYETARLLAKNNPVIYNNLAEVLIEMDVKGNFSCIVEYLEKAERYSNRRFQWWKHTREHFEKLTEGLEIENKHMIFKNRRKQQKNQETSNLIEEFNELNGEQNYTRRGNSFEKIMQKLISSLCPIHAFDYKIYYGEQKNFIQVDSTFSIGQNSYLGEFIYSNTVVPVVEIDELKKRLNFFPATKRGVLFSFSGFNKACFNYTKELIRNSHSIILINGEEIIEILKYSCLKHILELKVAHLETTRNTNIQFKYTASD
jgi:hypothetical protein